MMATVACARCGKNAGALPDPPMGGTLGATLQERVCAACYADWIGQQNLLINHYGLSMADPDDRKRLIAAMKEYLGLVTA
ncbi:MAG: Fe-S cluster protector protein [Chthonomonadales bacterium]|nr:Fe-S cluster protector protein [Chthonomonadales bacterium]